MESKPRIPYERFPNAKVFLVILVTFFITILTSQLFRTTEECNYNTLGASIPSNHATKTWKQDRRFKNKKINGLLIFKESRRAHRLLGGMFGLEIGASTHNPYGVSSLNVDFTDSLNPFNHYELEHSVPTAKVHIVTSGDNLPFTNESVDFVLSSHVIEHFYDPIKAIKEWFRVIKPGGYVYMDIPHQERTFDRNRNRTTLAELLERHANLNVTEGPGKHHTVWVPEDVLELAHYFNWTVAEWSDQDDKTGSSISTSIGFTVVLQKESK